MRYSFYVVTAIVLTCPTWLFAQEVPDRNLVNLPIGPSASFDQYINAIYAMFISIAALIAVVKIIIAGVKYMFSDIVTQKSDAKKDIKGALLGLVVVLSAVLILTIINPDLTSFNPDINQLSERERVILVDQGEAARERCQNSDLCVLTTCDNNACTIKTAECRAEGREATRVGDKQIACIGTTGGNEQVQKNIDNAQLAANKFISDNNEYSNIEEIYNVNQFDRELGRTLNYSEQLSREEVYESRCESNPDNTFVRHRNTESRVNVYMCVS